MNARRKELHDLIDEARDEDLPLLSELVARFQRPLEFALQPPGAASAQSDSTSQRQELILEAHMAARWDHLEWQHVVSTALQTGFGAGSAEVISSPHV